MKQSIRSTYSWGVAFILGLSVLAATQAAAQGILPSFMRRVDPEITDLSTKLSAEQIKSQELQKLMEQLKKEKDELQQLDERERANGNRRGARPALKVAALIVGNSAYGIAPLANPTKDANAVADLLKSFGYDVELLLDGTRRQTIEALVRLQRRSVQADVALLFYAGHGAQVADVNYLLPVDTTLTEGTLDVEGIAINQAAERYLSSRVKLVFLDACRNNPLAGKGMVAQNIGGSESAGRGASALAIATRTITAQRNLAVTKAPESATPEASSSSSGTGTLISYATKEGFVALDGDNDHSPYTKALLHHLRDDADISVVLRRVRQRVLQATGGTQVPWEYGSLVSDELVLAR